VTSLLLTVDQGRLDIVLIRAKMNQIDDLLPLADAISEALLSIKPGQIIRVPKGA
jgi:hypothetical protein